jgi:potassium/hydrogen antiporter
VTVSALRPGDLVWLFARPDRVNQLDRLFASPAGAAEADRQFFGDFPIDPHARMTDLGLLYGLAMPPDCSEVTVAQWMADVLGTYPGIGDRIALGEVELIVRALGPDDAISEIGLATEPTQIDKPRLPLFPSGREIRHRIKGWLKRRG